ncbi:hypothetical protein [Aestuariispira ectoiniformans]|uniref:hypothetical protein n=1 Tax=Aestuariispira ectoiniformans TaxID=2775080 RepID=UPI00223C32A8|nr:hypothetical protein [Aestuariispira ectoiniformans]
MLRLLGLFGMVQICFVFLGNALKSVVTSTIFTDEGTFASFLHISVDKTGILVELLVGSAVLALAMTPVILTPQRARKISFWAAALSVICFGLLGVVMIINPSLFTRELAVIATFTLGGFCIAFFAPLAQQAINSNPDQTSRVALTTIWTSAQPVAFLITPQLVKYVAQDVGTGQFFLGFAAIPLVIMLLSHWIFPHQTEATSTDTPPSVLSRQALGYIFAGLITFEAMTAAVSFVGLDAPATLGLMGLFALIVLAAALRYIRADRTSRLNLPPVALFLMLSLFILEMPTTGLYDSAYLVRHLCSSTLIEDRATYGAAAQILMVFVAGAIFTRNEKSLPYLLGLGILLLIIGTVGYTYYPDLLINADFFYISKMIASAGMGMVTTVIVALVMAECKDNPLMTLAPAFVIMFGTEFGLETLEILFEGVKLMGYGEVAAYRFVFVAQVILVLAAIPLAVAGVRIKAKPSRPLARQTA